MVNGLLERPRPARTESRVRPDLFAHVTPNWFAAVMGTGITGNAVLALPGRSGALTVFGTGMWVLATILLVVISGAFGAHWVRHREQARSYATHPVMGHFYGALPMAILTVGAGFAQFGPTLVGGTSTIWMGGLLWAVGTAIGVFTCVAVPYAMMTSAMSDGGTEMSAIPAWLMPVVPPMVSASTGAALIEHLPEGQLRLTMIAACYALFGMSLVIGSFTMVLIYGRMMRGAVPAGQSAPTIWITLGMIGQSITAANLLGEHAGLVFVGAHAEIAVLLKGFGALYGMVFGGFGAVMFTLAVAWTIRAVRRGLPFALTWWSFTFPIGTCVTGAAALGHALGDQPIDGLADALYALLVIAWVIVAAGTVRHATTGRLFVPA